MSIFSNPLHSNAYTQYYQLKTLLIKHKDIIPYDYYMSAKKMCDKVIEVLPTFPRTYCVYKDGKIEQLNLKKDDIYDLSDDELNHIYKYTFGTEILPLNHNSRRYAIRSIIFFYHK